ncbi:MAG: hypothetical protein Q8Q02_09405 [Nocardioides sp.]|nr:hypothetical protein [Nocardioides sp.]
MTPIVLAMLVIVALAALVVVYVAYPHRDTEVPRTPWIGDALKRAVAAMPTIDNQRSRVEDETSSEPSRSHRT